MHCSEFKKVYFPTEICTFSTKHTTVNLKHTLTDKLVLDHRVTFQFTFEVLFSPSTVKTFFFFNSSLALGGSKHTHMPMCAFFLLRSLSIKTSVLYSAREPHNTTLRQRYSMGIFTELRTVLLQVIAALRGRSFSVIIKPQVNAQLKQ